MLSSFVTACAPLKIRGHLREGFLSILLKILVVLKENSGVFLLSLCLGAWPPADK